MISYFLSFEGRATRADFWLFGALAVALRIFDSVILNRTASLVVFGLIFWFSAVVCVRRCHDHGRSRRSLILPFAVFGVLSVAAVSVGKSWFDAQLHASGNSVFGYAFANSLLVAWLPTFAFALWGLVYFGCMRGTVGPNLYGEDPIDVRQGALLPLRFSSPRRTTWFNGAVTAGIVALLSFYPVRLAIGVHNSMVLWSLVFPARPDYSGYKGDLLLSLRPFDADGPITKFRVPSNILSFMDEGAPSKVTTVFAVTFSSKDFPAWLDGQTESARTLEKSATWSDVAEIHISILKDEARKIDSERKIYDKNRNYLHNMEKSNFGGEGLNYFDSKNKSFDKKIIYIYGLIGEICMTPKDDDVYVSMCSMSGDPKKPINMDILEDFKGHTLEVNVMFPGLLIDKWMDVRQASLNIVHSFIEKAE